MQEWKRYPRYKETGVEWLGEVPEHWEVRKLKDITYFFKGKQKNNKNLGLEKYPVIAGGTKVLDYSNTYNYENVITISSSGANAGYISIHNYKIWASDCSILKNIEKIVNFYFLYYLLKSKQSEFFLLKKGIAIPHVYIKDFKNILFSLPPLEEQEAIANYLEKETSKIDTLVQELEEFILLLEEEKQSVISHTVTKGLNPNASMKDSGVEWLGEVPEHWEVRKLKDLLKIKNGRDYKSLESKIGYPVYGSGGQFAFSSNFLYKGESILLGRKGTIDKPLYVNEAFWTVDTMFYTICKKGISTKYIYYCSKNIPFNFYSTSTALPSITQSDLLNHKVILPPLEEQEAIASYLDKKTSEIDNLIQEKKAFIQELKEYRQSIISHVVTGKIDVREPSL